MPEIAYPRILQAILDEPWAILPSKMAAIIEAVQRQVVLGLPAPEAYKDDKVGSGPQKAQSLGRVVAGGSTYLIPIRGTISPRMNLMSAYSGGTTTESIRRELNDVVRNPEVDTILFDIDSPGGSVYDVEELALDIFKAREAKHIIAISNQLCASAAYYLGSQAHEFIVTPSGEAGSIGVVCLHYDYSKAYEEAGITPTYIYAGKYKIEGNEEEPLGDEAREFFQKRVDQYYLPFVEAVSRGRNVKTKQVRDGFGQGRVLGAKECVAEGLADSVRPLAGVLSDLHARANRSARRRSAQLG